MEAYDSAVINSLVGRVLNIESVETGSSKRHWELRYKGRLNSSDSAAAYDQLSALLRPYNFTPLFRTEKGKHVVLLMNGIIDPGRSRVWINVVLFLLTVLSVFSVGVLYTMGGVYESSASLNSAGLMPHIIASLGGGAAFTVSLLAILLAHEFGHYLAGRYHKTAVTLPYFIPFPTVFGTLGAFIQLKEPPKNRRILLDIGIAGPIAGFVVAVPVLLIGLALSQVSPIPNTLMPGQGLQIEGNSILYLLSKFVIFGQLLPSPASYGNLNEIQYWIRYFFTGHPLPLGGMDVILHPVAWAGWAGLLVTALNLLPVGQLDGGHVIYVLMGKRASYLLPVVLGGLLLLGFFWPGWWIWAFLIFLLGRFHAEPLDQITPLDPPRALVALAGLAIFVLVFTPVPLMLVGL